MSVRSFQALWQNCSVSAVAGAIQPYVGAVSQTCQSHMNGLVLRCQTLIGKDLSSLSIFQKVWVISSLALSILMALSGIAYGSWLFLGVSVVLMVDTIGYIDDAARYRNLEAIALNAQESKIVLEEQKANTAQMKELVTSFTNLRGLYQNAANTFTSLLEKYQALMVANDADSIEAAKRAVTVFEGEFSQIQLKLQSDATHFKQNFDSMYDKLVQAIDAIASKEGTETVLADMKSTLDIYKAELAKLQGEIAFSSEFLQALQNDITATLEKFKTIPDENKAILEEYKNQLETEIAARQKELSQMSESLETRMKNAVTRAWEQTIEELAAVSPSIERVKEVFLRHFSSLHPDVPSKS